MTRQNLSFLLILLTLAGCSHFTQPDQKVPSEPKQFPLATQVFAGSLWNRPVLFSLEASSNETVDENSYINEDNNLWPIIAAKMSLAIPENKRILQQRDWFVRHPKYLERVTERARPFLYHIANEIEKRDMPMELALLPIVESAFNPFAYSHGRASGIWQFIPGTGKRFGLKQNWWYDGRRDVLASTHAALDYLSYLNRLFDGNWMHALAAYNSGEGNVLKAIRRNRRRGKPTDFWSLSLPKETEAYVPKLLALADLVKRPEDFGIVWPAIDNRQVIEAVPLPQQMDLAKIADMAAMSLDEIYLLNPAFNRWATDPKGPHYILLPIGHVELFKETLEEQPDPGVQWIRYKIKPGDSLIRIAKKYRTSPRLLQQTNGLRSHRIRQGKHLLVPVASQSLKSYNLSAHNRLSKQKNLARSGYKTVYRVKSGDTLWDIANLYKINVRKLAKWNGMAPTDPLKVNQKLVLWLNKPTAVKSPRQRTQKIHYTVRRGDSLDRISNKFRVKISDLLRWNNLNISTYLQPGQKLTLFVDVLKQS